MVWSGTWVTELAPQIAARESQAHHSYPVLMVGVGVVVAVAPSKVLRPCWYLRSEIRIASALFRHDTRRCSYFFINFKGCHSGICETVATRAPSARPPSSPLHQIYTTDRRYES